MAENFNRLLIVEDDSEVLGVIAAIARRLGFTIASTGDGADFLRLVDTFRPTAIVLDLHMPATDGVELLRLLVARDCKAQVLLLCDQGEQVLTTANEVGASLSMHGVLTKPVVPVDLLTQLASVLKQHGVIDAAELSRGIASGELVPYYQPKASFKPRRGWVIDGVEALVRWLHPKLGLVMPDEFIPLAERTGLITQLTDAVLALALRQVRSWNDENLRLKCAVNLAPSLVTDLSFPDRVGALLAGLEIDGSQLALELTETATMQDPTKAMDILTRLRVKRVCLSLDDFGTGFSSLTRLYQMPFDEMKIDKSLVSNIPHSREANTMVGSLVELGHNLGLTICAEGVESLAALGLLGVMGCDHAQGFFISRAIAASEIPSFVDHWNNERSAARSRSFRQAQAKGDRLTGA
jgi:EAL domain-containing protein (putative c-di-GMP-specific phosphodiesterase class I)/CheY-like chemotaxis protein